MTTVPMPARMAHLPLDARGFPTPVVVLIKDGAPVFTINDAAALEAVWARDLCGICGQPLTRGRWFVMGPASALDPNGAYVDPPMHHDCLDYAMRVCPYLAAPRYGRLVGPAMAAQKRIATAPDPTANNQRPPLFVAVFANGQKLMRDRLGVVVGAKPRRPIVRFEFWCEGVLLPEPEGRAL